MAEKSEKSERYLYVPTTGSITVRFVGEQVEMYQYYNKSYFSDDTETSTARGRGMRMSSPFSMSATRSLPQGERVFFRETNNGDAAYAISKRIVSLVIDRETEQIKAFPCPISAWNQITEHPKENDFKIYRKGYGLQTKYYTEPMGLSEITDGQAETIEATLDSYDFSNIFVDKKWELVNEVVERINNRWEILDL